MNKIVTCLWFDHGEAQKAADILYIDFPQQPYGHVLERRPIILAEDRRCADR